MIPIAVGLPVAIANLVMVVLLRRQVEDLFMLLSIVAVDGWLMRPWTMLAFRRALAESERER